MQAEAEATLEKYNRLAEEMGTTEVEAFSEDGRIRVKLDADGKVAEIGIDESAMRFRQTLGPAVMAVIEEAKAAYGVKMTEMAQALVGDRIDVMGIVRQSLPEHMRGRFDQGTDR
nr:YbaB/EbfC family nucleoid-associated protein [Glycomyces amatae]